jgi:hypothetical protein
MNRLTREQIEHYRNELKRITYSQVQIFENGLFHIYNVKANNINNIMSRIRHLDFIETVSSSTNGKYDFNNIHTFGGLPQQYYDITGRIKLD